MSGLTREAFRLLLEQAIRHSMDLAQQQVADPLPSATRLELALAGYSGRMLSLEEVVSVLYREGTFPRIVDVFVQEIADEQTLIFLRPSGYFPTNDLAQTWNQPAGMGPFKSLEPSPAVSVDLEEAVFFREFVKKLHRQVGEQSS